MVEDVAEAVAEAKAVAVAVAEAEAKAEAEAGGDTHAQVSPPSFPASELPSPSFPASRNDLSVAAWLNSGLGWCPSHGSAARLVLVDVERLLLLLARVISIPRWQGVGVVGAQVWLPGRGVHR